MIKMLYISMCLALLAACSGPGTPPKESATIPAANNDQSPEAVARRIVAEHTGAAPADITVISVEVVEFSDSSLGCPNPEMAYLQVITPGHKVVASTADSDEIIDVRLAGRHGFVCTQQVKPSPAR